MKNIATTLFLSILSGAAFAAPLERIPLFVRAGSIVPTSDAVEIYGGADGSFELYSDDGESLGYLAGDYRRIPVAWDDAKKTVVVGRTKKATPTTLRFRLKGTDEERAVDYCGERVELKFPASPFSPQHGYEIKNPQMSRDYKIEFLKNNGGKLIQFSRVAFYE